MIFLAELGDKTQLTAIALALRYPWRKIFVGIEAAFAVLNLAAVVVGKVLFLLLPIFWVTPVSVLLFLYFGYLERLCDRQRPGVDHGLLQAGSDDGRKEGEGHVVKQYVEQYGGVITFSSSSREDKVFLIRLPAAKTFLDEDGRES